MVQRDWNWTVVVCFRGSCENDVPVGGGKLIAWRLFVRAGLGHVRLESHFHPGVETYGVELVHRWLTLGASVHLANRPLSQVKGLA